jgi:hypothetical protein
MVDRQRYWGRKAHVRRSPRTRGTEHTQVVYRELTGSWFRLDREQDGIWATEIEVEPAETDAIPLETLLNAQRNPQMAPDATLQPAERYDVKWLTKAGIETGWNWQQMFSLNQQGACSSSATSPQRY